MGNTGIKGGSVSRSRERNIDRELKRAEPQSKISSGDICAPIVKSAPFAKSSERRRDDEYRGGPQKTGNAKISSDSRTQDLISDKNPKLDRDGNRKTEYGGFTKDSDRQQGNVTGSKGKGWNRDNQVMNSDDSI